MEKAEPKSIKVDVHSGNRGIRFCKYALVDVESDAPIFMSSAYRAVEDISDQWWSLVSSSPWFRDYGLQKLFEDPQAENDDHFLLPDLNDLFESKEKYVAQEEEMEKEFGLNLVTLGSLKLRKLKVVDTPRFIEKALKRAKVQASLRCIQLSRRFSSRTLLEKSLSQTL